MSDGAFNPPAGLTESQTTGLIATQQAQEQSIAYTTEANRMNIEYSTKQQTLKNITKSQKKGIDNAGEGL